MRLTRFGNPLPKTRSDTTVLIVEPTLGYFSNQPPTDIPVGGTPDAENWMMRDGSLSPRPTLSQHTANANPLNQFVTGGIEVQSSVASRYNLVSGTTNWAYYSTASYSPLSYVSSAGRSTPPSATSLDRVNFSQIYEPTNDDMIAIGSVTSSYQTLFCWKSGATIFSTLTQAPRARWNATLDNFVLAANIRDVGSAQSKYVQRIQWSDRGNPFAWTPASGNLAGNQDLLDANGQIQRLIAQESRVVIFFDDEIWTGVRGSFPNTFTFTPLDRSIGTPYGNTCADTPKGIIFLARDFQVYLLPKEGGPAQPIGDAVHPALRETIAFPENSWAVYDTTNGLYHLYYPVRGGTALPQRALWLDVQTGAWAPQRWDRSSTRNLTTGWGGLLATGIAGISWSALSAAGYTWATIPYTWGEMGNTSILGQQTTYLGSSDGTIWYLNSNSTVDDGTERLARWRSGAFGGDQPDRQKAVNTIRLDYTSTLSSTIRVAFSRDQGETFDPAFAIALTPSNSERAAVGFPYTLARYPMFEVSTSDSNLDLLRFWLPFRSGGR
jgi:hypothetical protein